MYGNRGGRGGGQGYGSNQRGRFNGGRAPTVGRGGYSNNNQRSGGFNGPNRNMPQRAARAEATVNAAGSGGRTSRGNMDGPVRGPAGGRFSGPRMDRRPAPSNTYVDLDYDGNEPSPSTRPVPPSYDDIDYGFNDTDSRFGNSPIRRNAQQQKPTAPPKNTTQPPRGPAKTVLNQSTKSFPRTEQGMKQDNVPPMARSAQQKRPSTVNDDETRPRHPDEPAPLLPKVSKLVHTITEGCNGDINNNLEMLLNNDIAGILFAAVDGLLQVPDGNNQIWNDFEYAINTIKALGVISSYPDFKLRSRLAMYCVEAFEKCGNEVINEYLPQLFEITPERLETAEIVPQLGIHAQLLILLNDIVRQSSMSLMESIQYCDQSIHLPLLFQYQLIHHPQKFFRAFHNFSISYFNSRGNIYLESFTQGGIDMEEGYAKILAQVVDVLAFGPHVTPSGDFDMLDLKHEFGLSLRDLLRNELSTLVTNNAKRKRPSRTVKILVYLLTLIVLSPPVIAFMQPFIATLLPDLPTITIMPLFFVSSMGKETPLRADVIMNILKTAVEEMTGCLDLIVECERVIAELSNDRPDGASLAWIPSLRVLEEIVLNKNLVDSEAVKRLETQSQILLSLPSTSPFQQRLLEAYTLSLPESDLPQFFKEVVAIAPHCASIVDIWERKFKDVVPKCVDAVMRDESLRDALPNQLKKRGTVRPSKFGKMASPIVEGPIYLDDDGDILDAPMNGTDRTSRKIQSIGTALNRVTSESGLGALNGHAETLVCWAVTSDNEDRSADYLRTIARMLDKGLMRNKRTSEIMRMINMLIESFWLTLFGKTVNLRLCNRYTDIIERLAKEAKLELLALETIAAYVCDGKDVQDSVNDDGDVKASEEMRTRGSVPTSKKSSKRTMHHLGAVLLVDLMRRISNGFHHKQHVASTILKFLPTNPTPMERYISEFPKLVFFRSKYVPLHKTTVGTAEFRKEIDVHISMIDWSYDLDVWELVSREGVFDLLEWLITSEAPHVPERNEIVKMLENVFRSLVASCVGFWNGTGAKETAKREEMLPKTVKVLKLLSLTPYHPPLLGNVHLVLPSLKEQDIGKIFAEDVWPYWVASNEEAEQEMGPAERDGMMESKTQIRQVQAGARRQNLRNNLGDDHSWVLLPGMSE